MLRLDLERNLEAIVSLKRDCITAINNGKFILNVYEYDNIPHWHGFLINDELLFIGKCEWDLSLDRKKLLAGQKEYTLYRKRG